MVKESEDESLHALAVGQTMMGWRKIHSGGRVPWVRSKGATATTFVPATLCEATVSHRHR
jgi:hypothetical protein